MNEIRKCPRCGNTDLRKHGFRITVKGHTQQYMCKKCGHVFK